MSDQARQSLTDKAAAALKVLPSLAMATISLIFY